MALEAAIFDWDGPIADSFQAQHTWFQHICEIFGKVYPHKTIDDLRADYREPFMLMYTQYGFDWESDRAKLHPHFVDYMARQNIPPAKGIRKAIRDLNRTRKIGIASSNRTEIIRKRIVEYGIAQHISAVVGFHDGIKPKPDPESILMCLKELGVAAEDAAYIGDLPSDISAGKAAGCRTIAVTWGYGTEKRLSEEKPYRICRKPEELMDAVL
jgi:pyrophosphatase PpaX